MKCSRSWEVRAADEGRLGPLDVAALERHTRACADCSRERSSLDALRSLTSQLTAADPSELDLRRVRGRVLRDAMSSPSSRPFTGRRLLAVVAVAVTALAFALVRAPRSKPTATSAPFEGLVTPAPLAQWAQAREGSVERVTLSEGDLRLQVQKQSPGERFLVIVPDGEVEVRGTTFEVSVHEGHATRVHVDDGIVVVRVLGEAVIVAGGTWLPPSAPSVAAPPALGAPPEAPPVVDPAPHPAASPARRILARSNVPPPASAARATVPPEVVPSGAGDREMAEYQHAIDAYRLGRFEEAG